MARVGQPEPTPDGSFAIVPVTTFDAESDDGTSRLYRVELDGSAVALTGDGASSTAPAVSHDGTRIAFLRKAGDADKPQIHLMRLDGGEAECVSDLPLGVIGVRWMPDDGALLALVPLLRGFGSVDATTRERDRRAERNGRPVVTEDRVYRYWDKWVADGEIHHLFRIGLDGGAHDLTPDFDSIMAFQPSIEDVAVSPDGAEIAFSALVDLASDQHHTVVYTVAVEGGRPQRLTTEPIAHERRPRYSPDGRYVLYGRQDEWDFYADPTRLVLRERVTGTERLLASSWDRTPAGWEFAGESRVVFSAEHHGRVELFSMLLSDETPEPMELIHSSHGPRPAGTRLWCRTESMSSPPEVTEVTTGMRTGFNDAALAGLQLGAVGEIEFAGADGAPVQAYVVYPPGFRSDREWPLVHNLHGGPHGVTGDSWHWRWNNQVFAAAGYLVVAVNFHGSYGWGDEFTRSIRGAWGDKPGIDVMAATDVLLSQGYVAESKMAIVGGSYGGYLVTWLTATTDRFAAAICHAGVTDLLGQWASDITAGREKAVGGVPWDSMDDVLRWSPLAHTHTMSTPTLVIHGERDYRVVVTQGLELYGILKHKGVPARLVYYPDEGHWIEKRSNSIHWYGEFMVWLERWLG